MPRWRWLLTQVLRTLWVRATFFAMLGVAAALCALAVDTWWPGSAPKFAESSAVGSLLTIIATSMLSVTIFSLSTMTQAYAAATSNVTPRAARLLIEDRTAQNVLSVFVGSFLFSIVGIVVLKTGAYGPRGRAVLFAVTIAVIVVIVVALLRWIDHLITFGRVAETTQRVEHATAAAIRRRLDHPYLGGTALASSDRSAPADSTTVTAGRIGYVEHVDMACLAECADRLGTAVRVLALPGVFVFADTVVAWSERADPETVERIRGAFQVSDLRNYDQDPRFGLAVLSEVASRALSPAVNDPGTAIDVVGRVTRLLDQWARGHTDLRPDPKHPMVHVLPLSHVDLVEDAFLGVSRDGVDMVEVQLRIQKSLAALSRVGPEEFRQVAAERARSAHARAMELMSSDQDRERLTRETRWVS